MLKKTKQPPPMGKWIITFGTSCRWWNHPILSKELQLISVKVWQVLLLRCLSQSKNKTSIKLYKWKNQRKRGTESSPKICNNCPLQQNPINKQTQTCNQLQRHLLSQKQAKVRWLLCFSLAISSKAEAEFVNIHWVSEVQQSNISTFIVLYPELAHHATTWETI